jgi:hypothetical protein
MPPAPEDDIGAQAFTLKVIQLAMLAGVLMFLTIILVIRFNGKEGAFGPEPMQLEGPLTLLGLVLAFSTLIAARVVPASYVAQRKRAIAEEAASRPEGLTPMGRAAITSELMNVFLTRRIIEIALLEGAIFFNGIAFFLEGSAVSLIVAMALIATMILTFQTRGSAESWIETQRDLV